MKWSSTPYSPLFWLQACLLFFCFSNSVSADPSCSSVPEGFYSAGGATGTSASEACSGAGVILNNSSGGSSQSFYGSAVSDTQCQFHRVTEAFGDELWSTPLPIGYSSSGCASGYTLTDGSCKPDNCNQDPCPSSGTKKSGGIALGGISGQQGIGASMCADSGNSTCGIKCVSGIASYNEVSGQSSVYCETYEFSGSQCSDTSKLATPVSTVPSTIKATPVNDPPKSREDCPGGSGFAQVNNVGMCLPSGTQFSGGSSTTTSTSGSVTTTSTTTVNPGGTNTTTTTTTYKDGSGNVTYSGTTTGTDGINQAGNNGQGGEKLNLGDAPVFDQSLPTETNFNIKAQGNPVFSTEIFATSASCPPPINFSVMGREFAIDFSPICALADIIRGIILMLAAIIAMRSLVNN